MSTETTPFCQCVTARRLRYSMPRWRRLRIAGSRNGRYAGGRWTRWRQQLERQISDGKAYLAHFHRMLFRLLDAGVRKSTFDEIGELLGWLRDHDPWVWAMQDPRPGYANRWYVPRAAWTMARRWGQVCGQLIRLVSMATSTIPRTIASIVGREEGSPPTSYPQARPRSTQARARADLERFFPDFRFPWHNAVT